MSTPPTPDPARLNPAVSAADILFGETGTGKSSLAATYAQWIWERFNKVTLLYSTDGGGLVTDLQALIKLGIIRFWRLRTRSAEGLAQETCTRATQGYWPAEIDPLTGAVDPAAKLVPSFQWTFTCKCPKGHVIRQAPSVAAFTPTMCPLCSPPEMCTAANWTVDKEGKRNPWFDNVGAVIYDGISSMQDWIMEDMAARAGRLEISGDGKPIRSGELIYGGSNVSHYGFAQNRAPEWISNTLTIPGLVANPLFTALELKITDEETRLPFYGPKIAGKARTADLPQKVGNCLNTVTVRDDKGRERWRLYLQRWHGDDGVPRLAKNRAAPGVLPEFLEDAPGDPSFSRFSLGVFHEMLEQALAASIDRMNKRFGGSAPGLPSGKMDLPVVGGGARGVTPSPPQTPPPAAGLPAWAGGLPVVGGPRLIPPGAPLPPGKPPIKAR